MSGPVNRRRLLCQVYGDILGPCVELQRAYPILMPDTAVLVAAERGLRKSHQILVYCQSTNLEASREIMSYFQVACTITPVLSVIRLDRHSIYYIHDLDTGTDLLYYYYLIS